MIDPTRRRWAVLQDLWHTWVHPDGTKHVERKKGFTYVSPLGDMVRARWPRATMFARAGVFTLVERGNGRVIARGRRMRSVRRAALRARP